MASLPTVKRLTREDFKEAPEWITRLLFWLNNFYDSVFSALNKNLDFAANITSQEQNFEIIGGASPSANTIQFSLKMNRKPRGLVKLKVTQRSGNYVAIGSAVDIEWREESGIVYITSVTGLTNGTTYDFKVLLI